MLTRRILAEDFGSSFGFRDVCLLDLHHFRSVRRDADPKLRSEPAQFFLPPEIAHR
jgi:hypothetical protein